ncbi:MAG: hypothetical protein MUC36_25090 [Planctomycetes bacterium]|jgi:hypothetical protein|nr:hypothetical protein [Planctomycetota bacterium]
MPRPGHQESAISRTSGGADATARQVAALAARIAGESRRMEPDFLRLTSGLATLHGKLSALSRAGSELATEVGARLQEIRSNDVARLVQGSYDALQQSLASSNQRLTELDTNSAALAALQHAGRRLKGVATQLGVTRLGFSIECARLPSQEDSFQDFIGQLVALEKAVAQLGVQVTQQAAAARAEQAASSSRIRSSLGELGRLSDNCAAVAAAAGRGLDGLLAGCGAMADGIAGCVRAIDEHAGQLVYFLQFGDIVRQKLEHVAAALAAAAGSRGGVRRLLAVQAAQLDAVTGEIESARGQLAAAFAGLGRTTDRLVELLGSLHARPAGDGQPVTIGGLTDELRGMHRLRQRADDLGTGSAQAAAQAAEIAARMADHIESLGETNARMHLMALNAIVNTSRLGSSAAALGVLSIQVHEVARESSVIVGEVLPLLDRVRRSSQAMGDGAPATGASTTLLDAATVDGGLVRLEQLAARVGDCAARLPELNAEQQAVLAAARTDVGFLDGLHHGLASARTDLVCVRDALPATAGMAGGEAEEAEAFAAYTMESEREIHRAVTGGVAAPAGAALAGAAAGGDLGDNIELF